MKRVCLCSILVFCILAGGSFESRAVSQDDLVDQCPQADKYRLQRSFYFANLKEVVKAPQFKEEVKTRFVELASDKKWRRQAAISALALAGNLELFERLLAEGDSDGIATYASNYLRADGNLCIDPKIEKTIIRYFHDARFSRAFLKFFHKNLYSSRALFETLTPVQFEADNPDQYAPMVKALCATRLAGLGQEMLAIGKSALPHTTPVQKRVMPEVHQSLIRYFASQQLPVFSYFRSVLAAEPRSEAVVYFQNSYAQTRVAIYQALAQYHDEESFSLFLEQLGELSREPWGPFYVNDLHQLLIHLKVHPLFQEKKDKVIPLVSKILATPSLPGLSGFMPPRERAGEPEFYDQQVRKEVYVFLVDIDSKAAVSLLLDELASLVMRPTDDFSGSVINALLQGLVSLSEDTPVDVVRLLDIIDTVKVQGEMLQVVEILGRHPHPAGFSFVLNQFGRSFSEQDAKAELVSQNQIAARLFDNLLQFSAPEYLTQTRNTIDALFLKEMLTEERYIQMSGALAVLLGEVSPTYLAVLEAKKKDKEANRQQELVAAQARWRQEMVEEYVRQSSEEGIAANIEALAKFGSDAKKAGYWLIRVGKPILPQAHVALAEPSVSPELKMQLIVVLGEIGDVSSVPFIISAAQIEPVNTMVLKDAFLSLARIPQTQEATSFAQKWLAIQESSSRAKMSALVYFASHRDRQAGVWSRKFSSQGNEPPLRAAALYLGAMLGEKDIIGAIMQMLAKNQNQAIGHVLWRGLAEITNNKEFKDAMRTLQAKESEELSQIGQYVRFRNSEGQEKIGLAEELFTAKSPYYAESAIEFLLEIKEFGILAKYFEKKEPFVMSLEMGLYMSTVAQRIFSEARRQGYSVEEKDGKIHFRFVN
jgi:hypothetical protein